MTSCLRLTLIGLLEASTSKLRKRSILKAMEAKVNIVFVNSLTHSETINLARFKTKRFGKARIMRVLMKEQRLYYKLLDVDDA